MAIRVGIGSWSDSEYRGVLYPRGLPPGDRLKTYATVFDHVEVNSTFYGAPKPAAVTQWINSTPAGFLFDIKLHRVFSQSPAKAEIHGQDDLLSYTLERLDPLARAHKLGVFLLLLSGRFSPDRHSLAELDGLVERLKPHALAVEIRDPAWIVGKERARTFAYFRERGIAWVAVDMPDDAGLMPALDEVTLPTLAYLRLHGRNREGYLSGKTAAEQHAYRYTEADLLQIAKRVQTLAMGATEVRVVANNHASDFAPRAALRLRELLGQKSANAGDDAGPARPGTIPGKRRKKPSPPKPRSQSGR
jgi:uncharacterized protein YecE (DUF72 family)